MREYRERWVTKQKYYCSSLLALTDKATRNIAYKKDNWRYSIFTLLGFLIMIYFGFIYKGLDGDPFKDLNGDGKWNDAEFPVCAKGVKAEELRPKTY